MTIFSVLELMLTFNLTLSETVLIVLTVSFTVNILCFTVVNIEMLKCKGISFNFNQIVKLILGLAEEVREFNFFS